MSVRIFEVAILVDEKRDADGNITDPAELVIPPKYLLAKNEAQATTLTTREIPQEIVDDESRFERTLVVVRPF